MESLQSEVKTAYKSLMERRKIKYIIEQDKFDFSPIETKLGFKLHRDLKAFYNSYSSKANEDDMSNDGIYIKGELEITASSQSQYLVPLKDPHSLFVYLEKNDNMDEDGLFSLDFVKILDGVSLESRIEYDQNNWRADEWKNISPQLFFIGEIGCDMGEIAIILDNNDGKLYWYDFGYGEEELQKVPKGLLANSLAELLNEIR